MSAATPPLLMIASGRKPRLRKAPVPAGAWLALVAYPERRSSRQARGREAKGNGRQGRRS
jgi:hypothetical protein